MSVSSLRIRTIQRPYGVASCGPIGRLATGSPFCAFRSGSVATPVWPGSAKSSPTWLRWPWARRSLVVPTSRSPCRLAFRRSCRRWSRRVRAGSRGPSGSRTSCPTGPPRPGSSSPGQCSRPRVRWKEWRTGALPGSSSSPRPSGGTSRARACPARRSQRSTTPRPGPSSPTARRSCPQTRRLLVMGNIGFSQGLAEFVAAIERSEVLATSDAELRIAGHGVARDAVAAEIRGDRVTLLGLLLGELIDRGAGDHIARHRHATERCFRVQSAFQADALHGRVRARARQWSIPDSECARIVREAGAGWVCDARRLDDAPGSSPRSFEIRTASVSGRERLTRSPLSISTRLASPRSSSVSWLARLASQHAQPRTGGRESGPSRWTEPPLPCRESSVRR